MKVLMLFFPQIKLLLRLHKISWHKLLLQLNPQCQHDWLDTERFPVQLLSSRQMTFGGNGQEMCHTSILSGVTHFSIQNASSDLLSHVKCALVLYCTHTSMLDHLLAPSSKPDLRLVWVTSCPFCPKASRLLCDSQTRKHVLPVVLALFIEPWKKLVL